ncbi:MAG: SAM-dependent methyltransferase [Thermoproteus sp.]
MLVEDQREWQSRCRAGNTYSCFFCAKLRFLEEEYGPIRRVLDLTYGRGSFYLACRGRYEVVAVDIAKWDWLVEPTRFVQGDAFVVVEELAKAGERFDVAVIDPPYNTKLNHMLDDMAEWISHGKEMWSVERLVALIKRARAIARHVLVKYQPKGWKELAPLFDMEPEHLFIFRTVKQRLFTNVDYYKNATFLFHFVGKTE